MEKLKITYISNLYPPYIVGGAETIAAHLAEHMTKLGHEVTVISTTQQNGGTVLRTELNGTKVIRFFPPNRYWLFKKENIPTFNKLLWHVKDMWNVDSGRVLAELLNEIKPDIVHTHNIDGFSPIIWHEAKKMNLPVVHTAHDYHLMCPKAILINRQKEVCKNASVICKAYRRWYASKLSEVDVFCSPSRFLLELHKTIKIRAKDYRVVPNGIPAADSLEKKNELCDESQAPLKILYMGGLVYHKGIGTLLDLLATLPKWLPVKLNIAGAGPLEGQIVDRANSDSRLIYHGFVSGGRKNELLAANDILILPSLWYDNYPVSIIEAYQMGLAVLCSDIGGMPELVAPGVTGFLFPPGGVGELAKIINKLVKSPQLTAKLKSQAAKAGGQYTVESMARNYLHIYSKLLHSVQGIQERVIAI